MAKSRGPGLLTRLALALALVGLLPVGFAAVSLVNINRDAITEQAEDLHAIAARTTAERIGQFLENRLALALGLAAEPSLADPRSAEARSVLGRSLTAWQGLGAVGIAVVDRNGNEVIRAQLKDAEIQRLIDAAMAQSPTPQPVLVGEGDSLHIRLQVEVESSDPRLGLFCHAEELNGALEAYEIREDSDLLLVDFDRRALIGRQQLVDDFPAETITTAISGKFSGVRRDFFSRLENRQFLGAWAPVAHADWLVLSRQPLALAQKVERRMMLGAWLAIAGAVALIALVSTFSYLSVVRPIREVAAAQRRLAGLPAGGGGDEIGQLRAAFAALERRISEQERLDEVFLGRYQVTDVIGSGAMGTVFKGWDPKLKRPVALKTVRLDTKLKGKQRSELVERLLSEAVTVARFNHPNIVGVFDVEDHPEGAYVAMELVDGNSLEQSIWRGRRMPPSQVVPLGAAIARALAAAHQRGIVHRDIKPANVLLGVDGSIKVTDFGISELLSSLAPSEDVVFGTPGFVPPETLRGKGYDQAGDLFSMGAVLYTCLVGRPPFDGKTVKEVIRRTLFGVVEPPSKLVPDVPPELDELIMALLSREQGSRPADANRVAEKLEKMGRRLGFQWRTEEPAAEPIVPDDSLQESRWLPTTRLGDGPSKG